MFDMCSIVVEKLLHQPYAPNLTVQYCKGKSFAPNLCSKFNRLLLQCFQGIECADLVTKSTSTDMTSIPLPVLEISGKTTKFHAQASKDTRSGAIRCVVKKVTMAEINTENDLLTIRPTTVPHTPQPQQAPSRNQLATKRPNLFPEGSNTSASKKPK
ncbi:hypothetical protein E3N88_30836 [Mikania micrantha]|uniref:Uncharacterized protein n=1 Tax=Mikania micrantha TaxID=192012 RepID=A0A5N6MNI8_9ASTR|nr:hypothetical protein E3N88_30836 [Mikania micrantha]